MAYVALLTAMPEMAYRGHCWLDPRMPSASAHSIKLNRECHQESRAVLIPQLVSIGAIPIVTTHGVSSQSCPPQ